MEGGRRTTILGTGTAQDPFVIDSDIDLAVEDSDTFQIGLSGEGTLESPWVLRVAYAATAKLFDLPDVEGTPTGVVVLGYDPTTHLWGPVPPATATPGLILHDTSLSGDGSAANTLKVKPSPTRYLSVTTAGLGLSDDGVNAMVRVFPDVATRAAASPAPKVNTISLLTSSPGRIDYWDGSQWSPVTNGIGLQVQTGQFMAMSGPYTGGPVVQYVNNITATTDLNGKFDVISTADLAGRAGVLSVQITPVGTTAWVAALSSGTNRVVGTAYRLTDGTPLAGTVLTAMVTALLY